MANSGEGTKTINEHILKLQGKATLLESLDLGRAFKLEVDGAVDQTTDEDNQDGTFNRYYRFRPILVKVLFDNGEVTRTKDTRSRSKQMRAAIRREWESKNEPVTEEDYYDRRMSALIGKLINGEI